MLQDVVDRTFKDQKVNLDGYAFRNCRFDNCELMLTAEKEFALDDCVMDNCRFRFGGPAQRVVALLQHMRAAGIEILRTPERLDS